MSYVVLPRDVRQMISNRNAKDEEGTYKLPATEITTIKTELIGLMISVPPSLQSQLGEAISVIADSDFWTRWDTLMDVGRRACWIHH